MLRHHLLTSLRALRRDRSYALLGGASLAIALVCCLLVGMFVRAERTVDAFHPDLDRLRAVWGNMNWSDASTDDLMTQFPLAADLEGHAAVEAAAAVGHVGVRAARVDGRPEAFELDARVVSESYFDLFGFRLLRGDRERVLREPGLVLSERAARRLFGTTDALGEAVALERDADTLRVAVTGILADASGRSVVDGGAEALVTLPSVPAEARSGWQSLSAHTYLKLAPGATDADLEPAFESIAAERFAALERRPYFGMVPVGELHLSELTPADGFRGDAAVLRLLLAIAAFVLLLGVINYVNLATARAARRAGEVGVRKAVGATRAEVMRQFLAEGVALAVLAGLASLLAVLALLPAFNVLFGADLGLGDLDAAFVAAALALSLLTGVLAGAYPALVMSGFRPVEALRGASGKGTGGSGRLRQTLVVVQLVVAIALLSGAGVMLRQLEYVQSEDPGYDADGLAVVTLAEEQPQWRSLARQMERARGVAGVAPTAGYPTGPSLVYFDEVDGRQLELQTFEGEPGYLGVLGARLAAGRLYDDRVSDRTGAVVLNESAVRELGWATPADAVGRSFEFSNQTRTVIGVVEDQHVASFRERIVPMQVTISKGWGDQPVSYRRFLVRLRSGQLADGVEGLRGVLATAGVAEGARVEFLDERVAGLYEAERRLSGVLGTFAAVAILLACLGLFGLAAYAAERRTKEIGVRRVLGASVGQIVAMLSREYAVLVGVGALIAVPLAVVGLRRWLDAFAYHVSLGPGDFVAVVALLLAIALAVVSGQALRAARRDPVRALRAN